VAAAALPPGLIDTDILIDAERNSALAVGFLTDQQASGAVRMSSVSAMELMTGCRNHHELKLVIQSLSRAVILELS
jgi:predicted nucleic acid-binding protein